MASQYDCSAGTSGWACEYSTVPARNISRITGSRIKPPRWRSAGSFHSRPRNASTPTSPATDANSYMFDHGTASTATARTTIELGVHQRAEDGDDDGPAADAVGPAALARDRRVVEHDWRVASPAGRPRPPARARSSATSSLRPTRPNAYSAVNPTMAAA